MFLSSRSSDIFKYRQTQSTTSGILLNLYYLHNRESNTLLFPIQFQANHHFQIMSSALRISRSFRPLTNQVQAARFSVAARMMAEGDSGSARSGGSASSDAFTKREEASENLYIKQQEKQRLEALKAKIAKGEDQLAKDKKEAEDMSKK